MPTGPDGFAPTTYCPEDLAYPAGEEEGAEYLPADDGPTYECPGEFYFESEDGRCWNIPCEFVFGDYGIISPACQLTFTGPPHEVACNSNCDCESPRLSRRLQELGESESWDAKVGFHRRFANAQFAS